MVFGAIEPALSSSAWTGSPHQTSLFLQSVSLNGASYNSIHLCPGRALDPGLLYQPVAEALFPSRKERHVWRSLHENEVQVPTEEKILLRLSDRSGRIEDRPFCKAENIRTKSPLDQKSLCSTSALARMCRRHGGVMCSPIATQNMSPTKQGTHGALKEVSTVQYGIGLGQGGGVEDRSLRVWSQQPQRWEFLSCGSRPTWLDNQYSSAMVLL